MPTYEYECLECGIGFEAFQKMSDTALEECPQCRGKAKRLISSGAGVIFKGSGFYATDYKKTNPSSAKNEVKSPCSGCNQECKQKNKE